VAFDVTANLIFWNLLEFYQMHLSNLCLVSGSVIIWTADRASIMTRYTLKQSLLVLQLLGYSTVASWYVSSPTTKLEAFDWWKNLIHEEYVGTRISTFTSPSINVWIPHVLHRNWHR
jgi:hypothetical protein